jgi:ABC-2 type transport system permease protein
MRKTIAVAKREYNAGVKTKAFLISLLVMPLLMGGGFVAQLILKDQVDTQEKRFAIVDRTSDRQLSQALSQAVAVRNKEQITDPESGRQIKPVFTLEDVQASGESPDAVEQQRFELSERVRRGEIFAFLDIGPEVYEYGEAAAAVAAPTAGAQLDRALIRYQSASPTYDDFRDWARPILEHAIHEKRFQSAGLSSAVVRSTLAPVMLVSKGLSEKEAKTGEIREAKDENPVVAILGPAALMLLMFMLIFVGGTPALQGIVEEKMQRIAEMVLGSVRPFELMMGKLLGLMAISLTLAALYLAGGYWLADHYEVAESISPGVLAWFIAYLVVGVVMYGALFIAVGAACSDLRDTQTMLWPVMLVAMLPLFVWINVVREPASTFSTVASLIPTATPMLMILRIAVPPGVVWWQPALGLILMLLTTVVFVYAAGRIFRVGILMQGKGASFRDMARWIIRG